MKFVGIVGSNAEVSYNWKLLRFVSKHFKGKFQLDIVDISDVPIFNQDNDRSDEDSLQLIYNKIIRADGVIIATPEHNHTITPVLKNLLEWLSFSFHPLENKPVMIMGASYTEQGTSRAQGNLRTILDAPGVDAYVLPGNEFLLGRAKEAFDEDGNIIDQGTVKFLEECVANFLKFADVIKTLAKKQPTYPEDLYCEGSIETTVSGVDPDDPEWVEKASKIVGAAEGKDYVRLDHGLLTVDQINMFFRALPFEVTYADDNNQFLYYNRKQDADTMYAPRVPSQSGSRLGTVHPPHTFKNVEWLIANLRAGNEEYIRTIVPNTGEDVINVHHYQSMYYPNGSYAGINEVVFNFKPWLDWYLNTTGQRLTGGSNKASNGAADATSGASDSDDAGETTDTTSGASENGHVEVDGTSGASEN